MRKALALSTLAVLLGAPCVTGAQAQVQGVGRLTAGGSLSITEPGTVTLTGGALSGLAGSTLTGSLGSTVVTDTRNGLVGWTSTIAQTTAFTNGSTTIPVGNTVAWVPGVITTTGTIVVSAGTYLTQLTGLTLSASPHAFVSATVVTGNNTATFSPSIAVTIPSNATAGTYSGVITQTVS